MPLIVKQILAHKLSQLESIQNQEQSKPAMILVRFMFLIFQLNAYFFIIKNTYSKLNIILFQIPIDEKTSTIEEVDHEVLIGRPDYSEIVEDQSQNCWPKVASMKAIFEDMSN